MAARVFHRKKLIWWFLPLGFLFGWHWFYANYLRTFIFIFVTTVSSLECLYMTSDGFRKPNGNGTYISCVIWLSAALVANTLGFLELYFKTDEGTVLKDLFQ